MNKIYTYKHLKKLLKKANATNMQNSIDNDFLRDAMEGYKTNTDSFKQFPRILKSIYKQQGLHLGFFYLLTKVIYSFVLIVSVGILIYFASNTRIPENKTCYSKSTTDKDILFSQKQNGEIIMEKKINSSTEIEHNETYNIKHKRFKINYIPLSDPAIDIPIDYSIPKIHLKIIYLEDFKVIDYHYPKNTIPCKAISTNHGLDPMHENYEHQNDNDLTDLLNWEIIPYKEFLSMTLSFIHHNQYNKALQYFNTILEQYPNDLNAWFYSSYVYFLKANYEKALEGFIYVNNKDNECFNQEARWYMALCFEKLNQQEKANEIFTEIVSEEGFYSEAARNKLNLKP